MSGVDLNYIAHLEDEIALEGLDGITLQALWLRLSLRPNFESCMRLDENSKAFLWELICGDEEIFMYELPTPRENLVIFNRYELMDPELGIVLEPEEQPLDIYPFHQVEDEKEGVRGSCMLYRERIEVTDGVVKKRLKDVEEE
ncbi:General transcription factor 3C polypeptide 1 [Halocaridina rubra]|uniref:General transcription factor 3C polypeptide 1 n=1 Tax=Halocaridina rubra TaxID=373956 RepID=A0AAN9A2K9_HALRR